jgi:hypothetical protein
MRTPMISDLSAIVLGAVVTASSHAQMGYTTTTLEGMVAESNVVARARVVRVARGAVKEERCWATVTLKIVETIRGPSGDTMTFTHRVLSSDHIFEAWRDAGREHLWFFVPKDAKHEPGAHADEDPSGRHSLELSRVVRLGPPVPAEEGFGPPGQGPWTLPVFDHDLTLLSEPEAILRAARTAAAEWRDRRPEKIHHINLPLVVMERSGRHGDANRLDVPVGPHLERLARRTIESPGDFVSRSDFRTPTDEPGRKHVETWLGFTKDLLRLEGGQRPESLSVEGEYRIAQAAAGRPCQLGPQQEEGEWRSRAQGRCPDPDGARVLRAEGGLRDPSHVGGGGREASHRSVGLSRRPVELADAYFPTPVSPFHAEPLQ